jgi:bifunctional non-homologous end joining protein LigD
VRKLLASIGLRAFVKTTGGRGLHIVVPIVPAHDWSECLEFARAIAMLMAEQDPGRYTIDFRKSGREDKILIDYLRNNRTNTSIAAFSVRAREGAPVSIPVEWSDLKASADPARFHVKSVRSAVARRRADPWREYWRTKQQLKLPA